MSLSIRSWVVFIGLTVLMAANNVYTSLLTGWGDGGAIISVVLALVLLRGAQGTLINLNLAQTMASGGGAVGFVAAVASAFYVLDPEWQPDLLSLTILVMSVSLLGCIISVPLRRIIRQWYFPSGVACAALLKAVAGESERLRQRARTIMYSTGAVAALLTLPTKVAFTKGATVWWSKISLSKELGISLDPVLYGIGMVTGPRVGLSMFLAGIIQTLWLVPYLTEHGYTGIGNHVKWAAVGFMTVPVFTGMLFAFIYRTKRQLSSSFTPRVDQPEDLLTSGQKIGLTVLGVVCTVAAAVVMKRQFGVGYGWVLLGIALAYPLILALGKVAAETDVNAVRLLAIVLLGVFSLVTTMGAPQLLAVGVFCGAALASVAVDLFYDLRTGYLIGASPKPQLKVQLIGIVIASLGVMYFLDFLATHFGFGEGRYFSAPGAHVWAAMAGGFAQGNGALTGDVFNTFLVASGIGVVLSFLEVYPRTKMVALSPSALGIGLLLPVDMGPAIAIGGLVAWAINRSANSLSEGEREQRESDVMQAGSAVFTASAIAGIIAIILISLGWAYLPADE